MKFRRNIGALISSGCDLILQHRRPNAGLRLLLYHSVGSHVPHDAYGLSLSVRSFEEQINTLSRDNAFEVVSLNSLVLSSLGKDGGRKSKIAITFDDGYKDVLHIAAPILLECGFPFTVFVAARFIQTDSPLYLNGAELRRLSQFNGVTIGSHGDSHRELTSLRAYDLRAELADSRSRIEDTIGKQVDMLSYPHGKVDLRVREVAFDSGYRLGARSRFGINIRNSDPMLLSRTEIWANDSQKVFRQKYLGSWDWYGLYQRATGI